MDNQSQYQINQEQKFNQKKAQIRRVFLVRMLKRIFWILVVVGVIAFLAWFIPKQPKQPTDTGAEIISTGFLHWHPELSIYIKGEKHEIPANIGLEPVENPIHTHDNMGVIHLEIAGPVKRDDTKLGRFFEVWGKQFNENCIFTFCNSSDGSVKMFVNGQPNFDFENYYMKDGDKIEIRY